MRTVDDLEVSFAEFKPPEIATRLGLFDRLEGRRWLVIACLVGLAFAARAYQLGAASLAEDEANKIFALRAYEQGDFTVNAEHPMVMKMLCYASLETIAAWNRLAGGALHLSVSEEAALRLPNALFGALTVIPLLLLGTALLNFRVGILTALLWAVGINAVWFSRIDKEDSLLVFFMFSGFYLYHRAKSQPADDLRRQERLYALAGAAFGLMMASKYFPHYFGLNALYYTLVGYDSRNNRPLTRRMWGRYFGGLILAFVAFNPAAFVPQTWRYLWKYVNEDLLTHHGYVVMDQMFINDMNQTPGGTPWYFYFLFLAVKVPLPVLLAFVVGLVEICRHRGPYPQSRGYLFLRVMLIFWLFPMSLVGTKFLRYTLSLMPLVYMTAAIGILVMWRWLSLWVRRLTLTPQAAHLTAALLAIVFLITPAAMTVRSLPFSNLYVNAFGRHRAGYFFPHDEFYDLGARESIRYIADNAPPGARLATEIPGVVEYYLQRYRRTDIQVEIMSQPSFTLNERAPDYVLLQPGRVYFENRDNYEFIERTFPVVQSSDYSGATAARVYRVTRDK
ncbi:MAG TPA: glycosyltransferase family 39 protein [Blastocatellia bacterium]|nr:glycosyltransferase family 39 protein [Blastocatellia bacterium]